MMKLLLAMVLGLLAPLAQALSVNAALITQLQGEVTLESASGGKRPAVAFLKLSAGEKLQLKSGSRVQLVFFDSARQETWSGSGLVEVAETEAKSASLKADVRQLPALLAKQLAKTPSAGQHGRAGMVVMRSLPTPGKLGQLENQYAEFRKTAAADDLTPEVFYLSGLIELKEGERARTVLTMLRARQGDAAAQGLVEHFMPLADAIGKPAKPAQ